MHGCDRARASIGHEQRHAVRRLNGERSRTLGADQRVGLGTFETAPIGRRDARAVDLPEP